MDVSPQTLSPAFRPTPAASHAAASARPCAGFVWSVAVIMLLAAYGFILRYGSPVPYMDEWAIVPTLSGNRPFSFEWLWAQHNEHRIPLARLILLGIYHLFDFDLRAAMLLNATLLGALAFGMIRAAQQARGHLTYPDAFFPLALLNWGHAFNLLMGWQVVFLVPVTLAGILLVAMVRRSTPNFPTLLVCGICLLLLPLAGGMGLGLVPTLDIWLIMCGVAAWRGRQREAIWAIACALGALALVVVYFVGYQRPAHASAPATAGSMLRGTLEFLCKGLVNLPATPSARSGWPVQWLAEGAGACVCLAGAFAAGVAARAWKQVPGERLRALGLLAFLAGVGCLGLAVGWGRGGRGPGAALAGRYVSISVLLLCAAYFAFALYGRGGPARWGCSLLFWAGLCLLVPNTAEGIAYASNLRASLDPFAHDLQAGVPLSILAERYTDTARPIFFERDRFSNYLGMLRDAGLGMFRHVQPDRPLRTVRLNDGVITASGTHTFVLNDSPFIRAVRVRYAFHPRAPAATFRVLWHTAEGAEHEERNVVPQRTEEDSLLIWVNEPVSRLDIYPDTRPSACEIRSVELLLPAGG